MPPSAKPSSAIQTTSWRGEWLAWPHLLAFAAFCWLPLSYFRMVAWPWMVIWQVGWLALLGWGIWQLRQFQQPFRALGHGLDQWLAMVALVLLLSGWLTDFPQVAGWTISLVVPYGLGLYIYSNWLQQGWLTRQRLWLGLVVIATVTAIISLILWQPSAAMWQSSEFITALRNHQPLGHHNFVGGYFVLMLPLSLAGAVATRGFQRWLATVATALILIALYASGSRGALLGSVGWLLVMWTAALVRLSGKTRWRWGLIGVLVALAGVAMMATNPRIRDWFGILANLGQGSFTITDSPTLDRLFMLRLGGNILQDHPLLGVGPGVMGRVSNLYRPIEAGAGLAHIQQLHNTPLQLAGELGLAGLALYLMGVLLVGRLWWRLWQCSLTDIDRALLGGIGGGLLAYGVSSLTDYQLENIPIAGTLTAMLALLVSLGQGYLASGPTVPPRFRRGLSLGIWGWIGMTVYIWMPFTLTVAFGEAAHAAMQNQQLTVADSHWHKATILSQWDPTASAAASESLFELYELMGESNLREEMRSLLVDYALQAQTTAPNDVWFNQNLAVIYQDQDPAAALPFAARAVQLLPRNEKAGYFLLGQLLLAEGYPTQAIAAFTLEALVNPASLTYPLWQEEPLQALYPAVVEASLAEYDQLLNQLPPTDRAAATLYETQVLLGWWTGSPIDDVDTARLRPIGQALLLADTTPQAALSYLQSLPPGQASAELSLLAAWLDPDNYWVTYLDHPEAQSLPEQLLIQQSLQQRPLRSWLTSIVDRPRRSARVAVAFAYRNYQANNITLMLEPLNLQIYTLIQHLGLFQPWPREFEPLDARLETLRTAALGLPHPTRNHFQLASLSLEN